MIPIKDNYKIRYGPDYGRPDSSNSFKEKRIAYKLFTNKSYVQTNDWCLIDTVTQQYLKPVNCVQKKIIQACLKMLSTK